MMEGNRLGGVAGDWYQAKRFGDFTESPLTPGLVQALFDAKRFGEIEEREKGPNVKGDFQGSVAASWVRLENNGAGIVSYNKKQYTTRTVGFTSVAPGSNVMLTYANGVYYSSW